MLSRERNLGAAEIVLDWSWRRTSDKWHPVLELGRCRVWSCSSISASIQKIHLWLQSKEGRIGICFLFVEIYPFFRLVFWVFLKSKAGTAAACSCHQGWARLQQGRHRGVVRAGWCAGGAELPLESCWCGTGDRDSGPRRCAALLCLWSIPSLASSAAACHLGGTEMFLQWPFLFHFFPPWKLLHSGCCQFRSFLNHSRHVCRISVLSVIYTVLPGPFLPLIEK